MYILLPSNTSSSSRISTLVYHRVLGERFHSPGAKYVKIM
jgi:hypothetical protein